MCSRSRRPWHIQIQTWRNRSCMRSLFLAPHRKSPQQWDHCMCWGRQIPSHGTPCSHLTCELKWMKKPHPLLFTNLHHFHPLSLKTIIQLTSEYLCPPLWHRFASLQVLYLITFYLLLSLSFSPLTIMCHTTFFFPSLLHTHTRVIQWFQGLLYNLRQNVFVLHSGTGFPASRHSTS